MEIGKKLKEKRQEANLTQKELAEILHVSRQTISSWEVGRTYPDLETLVAISELYDTPLDDLLKEDSRMVEDITKKVKKSQRRKIINIILAALLLLVSGISISYVIQNRRNNQVNAEGLSAADLIDSTWRLHYDPTNDFDDSFISFGRDDVVVLNRYNFGLITPDTDPEKINEMREEWMEKGLEDGVHTHDDLKIETDGTTYLVTAYGYSQEFTRLSDSIIQDANGIEYYLEIPSESHESLYWLAEQWEESPRY